MNTLPRDSRDGQIRTRNDTIVSRLVCGASLRSIQRTWRASKASRTVGRPAERPAYSTGLPIPRKALPVALLLGLVIVASAWAHEGSSTASARSLGYDLTWWTVDGGGGTLSGSGYTLRGASGQPESGAPLTGGGYLLTGGLWSGGGEVAPTPGNTPTSTRTTTATRLPTATLTATATGLRTATATRTTTRQPTHTSTGPVTVTPTATRPPGFQVYMPMILRD